MPLKGIEPLDTGLGNCWSGADPVVVGRRDPVASLVHGRLPGVGEPTSKPIPLAAYLRASRISPPSTKEDGFRIYYGRPEPASRADLPVHRPCRLGMRLDDAALCGLCEPLLIFGLFQQARP